VPNKTILRLTITAALCLPLVRAQTPDEGNFVVPHFQFDDGEQLDKLNLHYMTLGHPARGRDGHVSNAVLILHGTGGSGKQFLAPQFRDVLFEPGELLDAQRYYIILPDDIGHGSSSKPSDGLRTRFPHYDYADMVKAEYLLVTQVTQKVACGSSPACDGYLNGLHAYLDVGRTTSRLHGCAYATCLPAHPHFRQKSNLA